jgi:hypothetical protein
MALILTNIYDWYRDLMDNQSGKLCVYKDIFYTN